MKTYSLWIDGHLVSMSNLPAALVLYQELKQEYSNLYPERKVFILEE